MRLLLILAALAALAVPAAASASAPPPPVIKEGFTLLPCPKNPQTTLALEGCAEHRIVKSDAVINAKVKRIYALLGSEASKTRFVLGERAWLKARRATCLSRADLYEGGTLAGVVFANCVADLNDAHVKDLRAFEKALLQR